MSGSGRRHTRIFWSGREAILDVRETSRMCGRPSQLSESGQETLPNARDATLDIWEWSGGYPGCSGVVERHYQMSGMPSRMYGSGRDALLDYQKWSGGPL